MAPRFRKRFRKKRRQRRTGPSLRQQVWNLPNMLTYGRILMIPFVMYFLYRCDPGADPAAVDRDGRLYSFTATMLFGVAAITDFFDGWIARNFNLGSMVGRFIDPLADKLLVMACLVMMVHLGRVPAWFVVLLVARELSITSLRAIAVQEDIEIRVSQAGKWKTAFQLAGLAGVMIHYQYPTSWGVVSLDLNYHEAGFGLLLLSMGLSLYSAVVYFYRFASAAVDHEIKDGVT